MKLRKRILLTSAILMLLATGASAKKQSGSSQKKNVLEAEYTINLHDNCPRTTAALNEEVALKATIPGYSGTFSVIYKIWPEEKHAYPLTGYYDCCLRIKNAIEKSEHLERMDIEVLSRVSDDSLRGRPYYTYLHSIFLTLVGIEIR